MKDVQTNNVLSLTKKVISFFIFIDFIKILARVLWIAHFLYFNRYIILILSAKLLNNS